MIYDNRSKKENDDMMFCWGGWDKDLEPGARYGPIVRKTYVIECCTGGYGSVVINGVEFPVKGGDCYILLPGDTVIHTADEVEPRRGVFCSLKGFRVGRYLAKAGITSSNPFVPKEAFSQITELVEKLVLLTRETDAGVSLRQLACMYELFGVLLRSTGTVDEFSDPVQKAIQLMETRYPEPLSVSAIASQVGLERCYFSTQFKEQTGLSPYQYLSKLRVRKACVLMQHSGCSVATAASSVGIPPENFARLFKRWMQVTPAEFRQEITGKRDA